MKLLRNYDQTNQQIERPTNRQADRRVHRKVSLSIKRWINIALKNEVNKTNLLFYLFLYIFILYNNLHIRLFIPSLPSSLSSGRPLKAVVLSLCFLPAVEVLTNSFSFFPSLFLFSLPFAFFSLGFGGSGFVCRGLLWSTFGIFRWLCCLESGFGFASFSVLRLRTL